MFTLWCLLYSCITYIYINISRKGRMRADYFRGSELELNFLPHWAPLDSTCCGIWKMIFRHRQGFTDTTELRIPWRYGYHMDTDTTGMRIPQGYGYNGDTDTTGIQILRGYGNHRDTDTTGIWIPRRTCCPTLVFSTV